MPYQGAVFFDADGTLIDNRHGIRTPTPKTTAAIQTLQRDGWLCVLATGRALCYPPQGSGLFHSFITSNGVYAEAEGTPLLDEAMEPAMLTRILSGLEQRGINYVAEGQEFCCVQDLQDPSYREMMNNYQFSSQFFYPLSHPLPPRVHKLMICHADPGKLERFRFDYQEELEVTRQPGNPSADVGKKGVSKGHGVSEMLRLLEIPWENTYAFGDADNDLTMLQAVSHGIAMGRCTAAVKRTACYQTSTVEEEGIEAALLHFGLLR